MILVGFAATDWLNQHGAPLNPQVNGTLAGMAQVQAAVGRTPSNVQDILAIAAVVAIIATVFFVVAPIKKR